MKNKNVRENKVKKGMIPVNETGLLGIFFDFKNVRFFSGDLLWSRETQKLHSQKMLLCFERFLGDYQSIFWKW